MNTATPLRYRPSPIPFVLACAVFAVSIVLSFTATLQSHPELAIGVTYDLALSAPFFYYLAIRNTRIPKITVAGVFAVGLITASLILPEENRFHVEFLALTVAPLVELAVAGFIGYKAYKGVKAFKKNKDNSHDLRIILERACEEVLGRSVLAKAVAFEMLVFAYAFFPLRKLESNGRVFTNYKKRGTVALYCVILFVVGAETLVLHFVVAQFSVLAAWILTISSAYIAVIILAQLRAIRKRPIEVLEDSLSIRYGLFCEASVPFEDIESVIPTTGPAPDDPETYQASLFKGFESINLLITLNREATAFGPYWTKKKFKRIAFFVDQNDEFLDLIPKYDND